MSDKKGKRTIICLSSSEEEEEEEEEEEDDDEEEREFDLEDDDEEEEEDEDERSVSSCSEWSEDEESDGDEEKEFDGDEDDSGGDDDDDSLSKRVICLLKGGSDLKTLNLKECKAYLRMHGLRISGAKAVCMQRIKEHWRLKDGNGEAAYPRSSFTINCTGDVCMGDTVLFTQKVYAKYDKVTRRGRLLGKRTIAGRVVKESYGKDKQQHTFVVEVLWSKGIRKLPPLFPLLVKGRNLYKLKTFRQRWKNEADRIKVLAEKHKRGAAARLVRAMRRKKASDNGGRKRQKNLHSSPPHKRPNGGQKSLKQVGHRQAVPHPLGKFSSHHQPFGKQRILKHDNNISRPSRSDWRCQEVAHHLEDRAPLHLYNCPYQFPSQSSSASMHAFCHDWDLTSMTRPHQFPYGSSSASMHAFRREWDPTSTMARLPVMRPYADTYVTPAARFSEFDRRRYAYDANVRYQR